MLRTAAVVLQQALRCPFVAPMAVSTVTCMTQAGWLGTCCNAMDQWPEDHPLNLTAWHLTLLLTATLDDAVQAEVQSMPGGLRALAEVLSAGKGMEGALKRLHAEVEFASSAEAQDKRRNGQARQLQNLGQQQQPLLRRATQPQHWEDSSSESDLPPVPSQFLVILPLLCVAAAVGDCLVDTASLINYLTSLLSCPSLSSITPAQPGGHSQWEGVVPHALKLYAALEFASAGGTHMVPVPPLPEAALLTVQRLLHQHVPSPTQQVGQWLLSHAEELPKAVQTAVTAWVLAAAGLGPPTGPACTTADLTDVLTNHPHTGSLALAFLRHPPKCAMTPATKYDAAEGAALQVAVLRVLADAVTQSRAVGSILLQHGVLDTTRRILIAVASRDMEDVPGMSVTDAALQLLRQLLREHIAVLLLSRSAGNSMGSQADACRIVSTVAQQVQYVTTRLLQPMDSVQADHDGVAGDVATARLVQGQIKSVAPVVLLHLLQTIHDVVLQVCAGAGVGWATQGMAGQHGVDGQGTAEHEVV